MGGKKHDETERFYVNLRTYLGKPCAALRRAAPQLVKAFMEPLLLKDCNIHPITVAHGEPPFTWLLP